MQVTLKMDIHKKVARMGINYNASLKFIPLLVLAVIWLWILLFVLIIGLNTTMFHSLFGWTAMIPHF